MERPYDLGGPVSLGYAQGVVEDAQEDLLRFRYMGKGRFTDDLKSFSVKIKR